MELVGVLFLAAAFFGCVYAAKAAILASIADTARSVVYFVMLLAVCVLVIWRVTWDDHFVTPLGNVVGTPVGLLFVPVLSFYFDLEAKQESGRTKFLLRWAFEVCAFVPVWWLFWGFLMMGLFRWAWI